MILFYSFMQGLLFSLSLCFDLGMVNVAIVKAGVERGFKSSFMIGFGSCFGEITVLLTPHRLIFIIETNHFYAYGALKRNSNFVCKA